MTYPEFLAEIDAIGLFRVDMGLERISAVAEELGILDGFPPSVIVAGTNGKGSAASFLDAIFTASGLVTGLTTSPHIFDFRERIRIGGRMIPTEDLLAVYEGIRSICRERGLTYFEITTLLAFAWFAARRPALVIAEVGLGGRLDATNILAPRVGLVMPVGFDHTEYLGDTITAIAAEKCGIVKSGMTVVSAAQSHRETVETIDRICAERGARHLAFGRDYRFDGSILRYDGDEIAIEPILLPGDHQRLNAAAAAVAAREIATAYRFELSRQNITRGISRTTWFGRLSPIDQEGKIIVDVGHNELAFRETGRYLASLGGRTLVVLGTMRDKLRPGVFDGLGVVDADFIVTAIDSIGRSATTQQIAAHLPKERIVGERSTVADAVALALGRVGGYERIAIVGSHYLVERACRALHLRGKLAAE